MADVYEFLMSTPRQDLKEIEEGLQDEVPLPLHTMLEKESKNVALEKYRSRQQKETLIFPPTCTGESLSKQMEQ